MVLKRNCRAAGYASKNERTEGGRNGWAYSEIFNRYWPFGLTYYYRKSDAAVCLCIYLSMCVFTLLALPTIQEWLGDPGCLPAWCSLMRLSGEECQ